jgi:hypothetical protein
MIQELFAEVEERNRLRRDARLPLLSVAKEVRRIYQAKQAAKQKADFERSVQTSPLRAEIEDEILAQERWVRGDPNWKPTGVLSGGGMLFHLAVRNRLRKHYLEA